MTDNTRIGNFVQVDGEYIDLREMRGSSTIQETDHGYSYCEQKSNGAIRCKHGDWKTIKEIFLLSMREEGGNSDEEDGYSSDGSSSDE